VHREWRAGNDKCARPSPSRDPDLTIFSATVVSAQPDLSIVIPLYNEEASVRPLIEAVGDALDAHPSWELVLVDDGSKDATVAIVADIARTDLRVRLFKLARNYGQTAAMQAGFDQARGTVVVSMDGDLQNDPRDIPRLLEKMREGYDLVVGYRERRQDKMVSRKIPSIIANRIVRWMTGMAIRDNGCSLKAYRRELLDRIRLYSDMHRFIPAVSAGMAGARIAEVPVRHHARRFGQSKYGLSRILKVLGDLLVVKMIVSFRERPVALFASAAWMAVFLGVAFASAAGVSMAFFQPGKANALVLPTAALLWFWLACYLFMIGLLGEVAVRKQRERHRAPAPLSYEDFR
jgi:glycosyltransferase involved in cell wall biosynthesis